MKDCDLHDQLFRIRERLATLERKSKVAGYVYCFKLNPAYCSSEYRMIPLDELDGRYNEKPIWYEFSEYEQCPGGSVKINGLWHKPEHVVFVDQSVRDAKKKAEREYAAAHADKEKKK